MYPLIISLLMMLLAGPATGGTSASLPEPVDLADGSYAFHYDTREGVTGDCESFRFQHGPGHGVHFHRAIWPPCDMEPGPAWVTFTVRGGEVRRLDLAVGDCAGRLPRGSRDLGPVAGSTAADWLLNLAGLARSEVGEEAVMGAVLARDADPVDRLVDLVQDRRVDGEVREGALHLLAALAGAKVIEPVKDIIDDRDEDMEFRESAVFALSQLEDEQALDALLDIGRSHGEPQLQRAAIFALTQYEDERVVDLYKEILQGE